MARQPEPLDLEMMAEDMASMFSRYEYLDVSSEDVRRVLVPFIDALAPDRLTDEQRIGLDLPRGR